MKVLMLNGSPKTNGNTMCALTEIGEQLKKEGIDYEIFQIGSGPIRDCIGCGQCSEQGCVFDDDGVNEFIAKLIKADGLVIGTPNYLGDASAGFRAIYERLIFQSLTYQKAPHRYDVRKIPVLFIMTSNAPKEFYTPLGYRKTVKAYQNALTDAVGNTKVMIAGDTLQVKDYSRFHWTMFDPVAKQKRHETVFPKEQREAFELGARMVREAW